MENKGAIGKITQVISAVLDIKFPEGHLPEINDAIRIPLKKGGELIVEVAQHLGDDTVRCIALGPTDGLVRGMDAIATGGLRGFPQMFLTHLLLPVKLPGYDTSRRHIQNADTDCGNPYLPFPRLPVHHLTQNILHG